MDTGGHRCAICLVSLEPGRSGYGYRSYCPKCGAELHRHYAGLGPRPQRAPRPCGWCAKQFVPTGRNARKYCSKRCAATAQAIMRKPLSPRAPCDHCGLVCRKTIQANQRSLCHRCKWIATAKRRDAATARRLHLVAAGDDITWRELGDRDRWVCHICSGRVLKEPGTAKNPKGATVDHLVPVSDGGLHVWDNVALAHRVCNVSRGARGEVQLRLTI